MKSSIQFVNWFPDWKGFGFTRLNPKKTAMALIYDWYLWFGFWEVRKWHDFKDGEIEAFNKGRDNNESN